MRHIRAGTICKRRDVRNDEVLDEDVWFYESSRAVKGSRMWWLSLCGMAYSGGPGTGGPCKGCLVKDAERKLQEHPKPIGELQCPSWTGGSAQVKPTHPRDCTICDGKGVL